MYFSLPSMKRQSLGVLRLSELKCKYLFFRILLFDLNCILAITLKTFFDFGFANSKLNRCLQGKLGCVIDDVIKFASTVMCVQLLTIYSRIVDIIYFGVSAVICVLILHQTLQQRCSFT